MMGGKNEALVLCCVSSRRRYHRHQQFGAGKFGTPYITETQSDYTVHNVSSDRYVWGFIISHQPGDAAFRRRQWLRAEIAGKCLGSDTQCFFFHSNTDISDPTFDIGRTRPAVCSSTDNLPAITSS